MRGRAWTKAEDAILRAKYGNTPAPDIAATLGRTRGAVVNRAKKIGVQARPYWTREEDAELIRLFPTHSAAECAEKIGRSVSAIHDRAHKLGMRKSREWIAELSRQNMADPNHAAHKTRFRPGQTSWNKGMKGLQTGGEAGWFRPGERRGRAAELWLPIGSYRTSKEGYLQRKLTETGITRHDFVPVHHLVWRLHGGTVPRGHALIFRDGDKSNFGINNLELVTRAELLRRNSIHRYPPEVKTAIRAVAALTRKLNRETSHEQHQ